MSRKIAPHMDIVRLEDKETKLKAFIRTVVELANAGLESFAAAPRLMLVARSAQSPAAKAIAALIEEGVIDTPVKIVFALNERDLAGSQPKAVSLALGHDIRLARDPRLYDAHEQLVLGPAASWIGDCMRRDPMKRDAYECFASDCGQTATWARISFERLWNASEPLVDDRDAVVSVHEMAADVIAATDAAETGEDSSRSTPN